MGLLEIEIRTVADLPAMHKLGSVLWVYRRGSIPDEFIRRLEFALSNHYRRAVEHLSFKWGELLPKDTMAELLPELAKQGLRVRVAGGETPRLNFYLIGKPESDAEG